MNFLSSVNWVWLLIGIALGWFILPKLSGRFLSAS